MKFIPIILAGAAVSVFTAHGGEDFTHFIKSVDMSQTYSLSFLGSPSNFPWDASTPSNIDKPFADLVANGVNYVRLNCWQTGDNNSHLNLTQMKAIAMVAKGTYHLKLYIDAIPADGSGQFGDVPAEWQTDWNTATNNNKSFVWNSTTGAALAQDVKSFYQNIVTSLASQGTPADMVSIGNEIGNRFVGVNSGNSLYYELVYKGAAGVKLADPSIGVMLHIADIGSTQWTYCRDLAQANSRYGTPDINFDVFGFSVHAFPNPDGNPLTNPAWQGSACVSSNGQALGLTQAFQTENLAQFTNKTNGKAINLMVAETAWIWTTSNETVNGVSYGPGHTSMPSQNTGSFTQYQYDASGYRSYLTDECSLVKGLNDGYGKGVNAWAGEVITGWGTTHGDWNMAFWDSATGALKLSTNGFPIVSAFSGF